MSCTERRKKCLQYTLETLNVAVSPHSLEMQGKVCAAWNWNIILLFLEHASHFSLTCLLLSSNAMFLLSSLYLYSLIVMYLLQSHSFGVCIIFSNVKSQALFLFCWCYFAGWLYCNFHHSWILWKRYNFCVHLLPLPITHIEGSSLLRIWCISYIPLFRISSKTKQYSYST